jgi:transposase
MISKPKQCAGCGDQKPIWKNHMGEKYCKDCWYKKAPVKFPTQKKLINPKSDKQAVLDQLYTKLRVAFLTKYPYCQARLDDCTAISTDVHHKKGRGQHYLEQETWLSVCRTCHDWIEKHPVEAKELGFSINRLVKEDDTRLD